MTAAGTGMTTWYGPLKPLPVIVSTDKKMFAAQYVATHELDL
jgi:hypothetical protein